jgi:DNA-binding transcriptional regulator LsrR (DeoR family)
MKTTEGKKTKRTNRDQTSLMMRAAIMKYKLGYSQREVAERMQIAPMTVSRLLDRARKSEIVQINVRTPIENNWEQEKELLDRYPLKKAVVFRNKYGEDPKDLLGRAAAYYLDFFINPGDIVGISAGRTMVSVIPHMQLSAIRQTKDLTVVQIEGGFTTSERFSPVSILQEFVNHLGVKGYFYHLPIYAQSVEAHEALSAHAVIDPIQEMWRKCSIILAAVGVSGEESIYRIADILTKSEMTELLRNGAVGSIFGRWFDSEGRFLNSEINDRVFSIPIEVVKEVPRTILISAGVEKVQAIRGAMHTELCDILITEEMTSLKLLE